MVCPGWSTKDLVSHLASLFWAVVDGTAGPDTTGLGLEEAAACRVEARRAMTPGQVLADYEEVSLRALDVLPMLAEVDAEIPFGEAESYPASLLPAAFCFDHYTHLRLDLFAPRGSVPGPAPRSDEVRLSPTLRWVEAALPKQNEGLIGSLPGRVDLVVSGPGACTIAVGAGEQVASVRSDGLALVTAVTQRAAWEDLDLEAAGDADALEIARRLRVY